MLGTKSGVLAVTRSAVGSLVPSWVKSLPPYQRFRGVLVSHDTIYDEDYYERDVEGPASQAAPHIAASIVASFGCRSVADIGCGTGAMLAAFRDLRLDTLGFEYSGAAIQRCKARGLDVVKFDIEHDAFQPQRRYDVALSMEVAEHIPGRFAGRYVKLLCSLSPIVVMSAAQPGQGGTDHVNLQPKAYWVAKFREHGFRQDARSAAHLASTWRANDVADFYIDNLMVFRRD